MTYRRYKIGPVVTETAAIRNIDLTPQHKDCCQFCLVAGSPDMSADVHVVMMLVYARAGCNLYATLCREHRASVDRVERYRKRRAKKVKS